MHGYEDLRFPKDKLVKMEAIECPECRTVAVPKYEFGVVNYSKSPSEMIVLAICQIGDCGSPFLASFTKTKFKSPDGDLYNNAEIYYYTSWEEEAEEIEQYSKLIDKRSFYANFITIYNQAHKAESEGLDEITGMGYRKSLEYLLKEYSIFLHPAKEEQIKKQTIADVITTYLSDVPILAKTAKAASWLGNDHSHFIKKWEGKDVSDLKKLILATLHWIEQAETSKEYLKEMGLD